MPTTVSILALTSAVFYCLSMYGMKLWTDLPSIGLGLMIAVALLVGGAFEVFALKQERLGLIYVGILGAEVVIIGFASLFLLNETYSVREITGIAVVLVGTAIAWT